MKQGIKRIRVTTAERKTMVGLYSSGAGNINEIARAMKRPKSTVYNVLSKAGVWESSRNKKVAKAPEAKPEPVSLPEPTVVAPGSIELISVQRRSIWQRIKDLFA